MKQNEASGRIFSLSKKLFCISVAILLFSLLFESAVVYGNSYRLVSETLELSTQSVVQNHAKNIDDFFRRTETISELMISEIPSQLPALKADTGDFYDQYHAYNVLKNKYNSILKAAIGQDIRYRAYLCLHEAFPMTGFLPSPEDDFLAVSASSYVSSSLVVVGEERLPDCEWYLDTRGKAGSSFWFMHPDNPDTIWIASMLEGNFLSGSIVEHASIGFFLIGIDVSWITEQLDANFGDGNSLLFVTDAEKRIIYSKDTSLLNQNIDSLILRQEISYHIWESNLADRICLLLLIPEKSFHRQIHVELQVIVWLLLFILAVGILLMAFYSRFITRPIWRLSSHMEKQAQLEPIAPYRARDEIGILYRVFNEMVEKQQELIGQVYHYSEERKRLKYQMLQAQINPHFLYNTLDSVGCAALMKGEGELTDVLVHLAALLRYNINEPEQLVTLAQELQVTDEYVKIQQFRYDRQLCYDCKADSEAAKSRVPKSMIQPLVENCIMYGHTQPDGCRYVSLTANVMNNLVIICLYNDILAGQEGDISHILNCYLKGNCQIKRNSSGLGVQNVQQRIAFVFGGEYGLRYRKEGEKLVTEISLPFFE